MAKTTKPKEIIKLIYDGDIYELTYTRESIRQMESAGFDIQAFVNGTKPATMPSMLFEGAFIARNKGVKRKVIDDIYAHITEKTELLVALAELYSNTLSTLTDNAAVEDDGKNVSWEAL